MLEWCWILEGVLAYIRNKKWVAIEEINKQMALKKTEGIKVLDFLYKFNFIEFDTSKEKIRLTNSASKLMNLPDS